MGAGRPKKKLNEIKIEELATVFCTNEEIAMSMGVTAETLANNYSTALKKGRTEGCKSLRAKQFELAMKGNVTMLIWLGKQYLKQSDKFAAMNDEGYEGFVFVKP